MQVHAYFVHDVLGGVLRKACPIILAHFENNWHAL